MKYDEAFKQALEYFDGDELAANVYLSKYALTNPDGDIEEPTPDDMHRRLAREFARIEQKYPNPLSEDEIFNYFKDFKYIVPQGSPMSAIGNPYQVMSLSNCFVIDSPFDSYGGILLTDQQQAQLMKRRGGVGFDISTIRPSGLPTTNAAKTTDGIGVFMERFSNTTREVAQGGRRGALMLTLSVHHPDVETFINIKKNLTKVTGANISLRLTDEFMNAVKNGEKYTQQWPIDSDNPVISIEADAQEIWDQIISSVHEMAEPGLLFWDTVINNSATDDYSDFQTVSTNPCGEITLSAGDSCRLMLMNTVSYVKNPFTPEAYFDLPAFGDDCQIGQQLMDDMVDIEIEQIDKILAKIDLDPEPEHIKSIEYELWNQLRTACINGRRTGLGVTAVGDALAALGIRYGSDESVEMVEKIYKCLGMNSYLKSITMAKDRGSFPAFDYELEKDNVFINQMVDAIGLKELPDWWKNHGRRNIACNTTAPAGSVSMMTQTTSGIEPCFLTSYTRRKKINSSEKNSKADFVDELGDKWQEFVVYHHGFKNWMDATGEKDYEKSPYFNSTTADIDWVGKVKVQAAAQKWVDHAISNTTNVPEDVDIETVKEIYMTGWENGCKGVTVYRDGSRSGVLVSDAAKPKLEIPLTDAPKRPIELECDVYQMTVLGEKWTMFVSLLGGRPYELMGGLSEFVTIPKRVNKGKIEKYNGTSTHPAKYNFHYDYDDPDDAVVIKDIANIFDNATNSAFSRTISLALRHGAPVRYVVEQIQKGAEKETELFSFSKACSRVLKHYIEDGIVIQGKTCLNCQGTNLIYEEGCSKCVDCGSSKCG